MVKETMTPKVFFSGHQTLKNKDFLISIVFNCGLDIIIVEMANYVPIFIHEGDEDPGVIPEYCHRFFSDCRVEKIRRTRGEAPSEKDLTRWKAAFFMGGHESLTEIHKYPYLMEEVLFLKELIRLKTPILGICLGGQLLSLAHGGQVQRSSTGEFGLYPIKVHKNLEDFGEEFLTYHWHSDIFSADDHKTVMSSPYSKHQLVMWDNNIWGTQFHPEISKEAFPSWNKDVSELKNQEDRSGFFGSTSEHLFEQYRAENDLFLSQFFNNIQK